MHDTAIEWNMDKILLMPGRALVLLRFYKNRVQELLEANNRYLERARAAEVAASVLSGRPCTGCRDKDGNLLYLGDKVRYRIEGPHTKREYWNPEYEIIFRPPSFDLKHVGGGLPDGNSLFVLRCGGGNGDLELIERGPHHPLPDGEAA